MHNESWGKMHRIAKSSKLELLSVRITMGSTTAAACAQAWRSSAMNIVLMNRPTLQASRWFGSRCPGCMSRHRPSSADIRCWALIPLYNPSEIAHNRLELRPLPCARISDSRGGRGPAGRPFLHNRRSHEGISESREGSNTKRRAKRMCSKLKS